MNEKSDGVDWSVTTWEGSRRAQLRHALELTLRERMDAVGDLMLRFEEMRAKGEFTSAAAETRQTVQSAREPLPLCGSDKHA